MPALALLNGELLPETFHFLHLGWFLLHIIAIPLTLYIGYLISRKKPSS